MLGHIRIPLPLCIKEEKGISKPSVTRLIISNVRMDLKAQADTSNTEYVKKIQPKSVTLFFSKKSIH